MIILYIAIFVQVIRNMLFLVSEINTVLNKTNCYSCRPCQISQLLKHSYQQSTKYTSSSTRSQYQKIMSISDNQKLGDYHPVRDEILLRAGRMSGLDVETWKQEHPGEDFPIQPSIDRGFPARWKDVRKATQCDPELLTRLGMNGFHQQQIRSRVWQEPWFSIADHTSFLDKFGRMGQKLGGHTVPSHGNLFWFDAVKTWDSRRFGEARSVKVFERKI